MATAFRLLYNRILIPPSVLAEVIHGQFIDEHAYTEHYGISGFLIYNSLNGALRGS